MDQEFGHSYSLCFGISREAIIKVSARAGIISRFKCGRIHFQVHSAVVGRIRLLVGLD